MAFPQQIEKLVTKLVDLSEKNKVEWQPTANQNSFLAPIGDYVVTLSRGGSEMWGAYSFQIMDDQGRTIDGTLAAYVGAEKDPNGHADWRRLGRLHELARRSAFKSEDAVSSLLSSLEQIR